ncbi:MAG: hypothetical protein JWQ90_663 [Hydrocarboniphaga sp.]|nr:hypothetical protein [Hydrocarboniphaga sp.]
MPSQQNLIQLNMQPADYAAVGTSSRRRFSADR